MVDTIKFSEMPNAGDINNNDIMPSLRSGENVILNNPWTFLPPGTTAQRPAPSSTINYRLRFNTDDQLYEYYNAVLGVWSQIAESAITNGPFITYTADATLPGAQNLGLLANGILKQTISLGVATLDIAVNATDYWAPGDALTRTQVPVIGDDVTNKTYVDSQIAGSVISVEGTEFQVLVNSTFGTPQTGALILTTPQDIATSSTPSFAGMTLTGNLDMGGFTAFNAANPVQPQDYATKFYVDQTALTGTSVYAASAASLGTVTQSGAGVGATLTNAGAQAALVLDGVSPPVGTDVLIKNTATGMTSSNEGIYTVTNAGSVSTNWVLTRSTSYNTPEEINQTGLILVRNGSTLAGTAWYNASTIVTVDTTAFSYSQFGNIIFPVTLANGGTSASLTAINGGIVYSTASAMAITAALANAVLITNGSSVPSLSTTLPSALTIPSPMIDQINDANGNPLIDFITVASSHNYFELGNSSTVNGPYIKAVGTDVTVPINFSSKGGQFYFSDHTTTTGAGIYIFAGNALASTSLHTATAQVVSLALTLPGVDGVAGSALQTNGSGILSFTTLPVITRVNLRSFTATGASTYTPTTDTKYVRIIGVAGGAGGGSAPTAGALNASAGGGGGAGGYAETTLPIATVIGAGTTAQVTVGALGAGGAAGTNPGANGGNTTVIANGGAGATILSASGGTGGGAGSANGLYAPNGAYGASGTGTVGDILITGTPPGYGVVYGPNNLGLGGWGGSSQLGSGGRQGIGGAGPAASGKGGGGGGGSIGNGSQVAGGAGTDGAVYIWEYISS